MRKSKRIDPKHIQIQFDMNLCKKTVDFCIQPQYKRHSFDIQNTPDRKQFKFLTNASNKDRNQNSPQSGVIRLKSKKKGIKTQCKQNIQPVQKVEVIKNTESQSKSKLNKYFQSARVYKRLDLNVHKNYQTNDQCIENPQTHVKIKTEVSQRMKDQQFKMSRNRRLSPFDRIQSSCQLRRRSESKSINGLSINQKESRVVESCSLNKKLKSNSDQQKKMQARISKIKQFKFIQQYLSDLELEGIFNELIITGVPEARWSLIIVDKVYQIIRRKDFNNPDTQIVRKF